MGQENFRSHPDLDADPGIFEGIFYRCGPDRGKFSIFCW